MLFCIGLLCVYFVCIGVAKISPRRLLPSATYSPIGGSLACNTRVNGTTTEAEPIVFWSFYLEETVDTVEINTISSKYNTKLWLYHYYNTSNKTEPQGWQRKGICDECNTRIYYPNEVWLWHLDNLLDAGYYYLGIGGFQDHVGDYSVLLKCGTVTPLYISTKGRDDANCGSSANTSCASLYYASTLIVEDYRQLHVIDGQNETQLLIYKKNQVDSFCLPVPQIEYIFYVYFDPLNVKSMEQWYPQICTTQNTYLFEHSEHIRFENLIIDNYVFENQGVIKAYSHLECYNCSFINNTFNVDNNQQLDIISADLQSFFKDCTFSMINIVNQQSNFIRSGLQITFQQNVVSQINLILESNFIHATMYENAVVSGCDFSNTSARSLFFLENFKIHSNFDIIDCTFSNINSGAIIISIYNTDGAATTVGLQIKIRNVNISTAQVYKYENEINSLFYFNPNDLVIMQDVRANYQYDLAENCHPTERDSQQIQYGYIVMSCYNPISLIWSTGTVTIENMVLSNGVYNQTISNYNEYILNKLNFSAGNITVNYQYEVAADYGLICNTGFLYIYNLSVDTVTFHDKIIYLHYGKTIFIDGVNTKYYENYCNEGIDCKVFDANTLISSTWIHIAGAMNDGIIKTTVNITNSYIAHTSFYGIYSLVSGYFLEIYISNSIFTDTLMAVWLRFGSSLHIFSTDFVRIGRLYGDKNIFYYNPADSHEYFRTIAMFHFDSFLIENCNFTHYNPAGFIYAFHNHGPTMIKNNVFELNIAGISADSCPFKGECPLKELILTYDTPIQFVDNYFGENNMDPTIPWIRVDDCPSHNVTCLSGNTFHGYGIRTEECNMTSCYRPQVLTQCLSVEGCCHYDEYGIINYQYNQRGKFILNNANISPFSIVGGDTRFVIDNVEFEIYDNRPSISQISDGNILIMDSNISTQNSTAITNHFSYLTDKCTLFCNELYSATTMTQTSIKCDSYLLSQQLIQPMLSYTSNQNITKYIHHLSASHLVLTAADKYFAGSFLEIYFEIADAFGTVINNTEYEQAITIDLSNDELSFYDELIINNSICPRCDSGIYISSITLADTGKIFEIKAAVRNDLLFVNDMFIEIGPCPSGYGENEHGTQCVRCSKGHFALLSGNGKCYSCDEENNIGLKCPGGDELSIIKNYWIAIKNITRVSDDAELSLFGNKQIISAYCPYNTCCAAQGGCDYDMGNNNKLCAMNRDENVPLCGACEWGYSASMSSLQCTKCDNINYVWLLCPMLLAFFISFYLIVSKSELSQYSGNRKRKERRSTYLTTLCHITKLITIMFKVILYYEQSLVQILEVGSIDVALASFASLFNVSVQFIGTDIDDQLCFIPGLSLKAKILTGFISVSMIVLILFVTFIFSLLFAPLAVKCFGRVLVPNLGKSAISMLLLCIGKILSIIFKLLSCQSIGENSIVHYYFGEEDCFGATWFGSFFGLSAVMAIFILLFVGLIRMNVEKRQSDKHILAALTHSYRAEYWWWEFVLFIRRVIVAFFAISIGNQHAKFILVILLIVFVLLQDYYQPFIAKQANEMELLLLMCLIIVVLTQIVYSAESFANIASAVLSSLILIPFVLLLIFVLMELQKLREKEKNILPNNLRNLKIKQRIKYFMLCVFVWYASQKYVPITKSKKNRELEARKSATISSGLQEIAVIALMDRNKRIGETSVDFSVLSEELEDSANDEDSETDRADIVAGMTRNDESMLANTIL